MKITSYLAIQSNKGIKGLNHRFEIVSRQAHLRGSIQTDHQG